LSEQHPPADPPRHRFLIHKRGDHVGVATQQIDAGATVIGVFMDDDSEIEVAAHAAVPLGHKIAIAGVEAGGDVLEYGIRIGRAPDGLQVGEYVHTHNLKSARW
jgi:(2R)-sulfolactate sulfo-lyase subunit alpha